MRLKPCYVHRIKPDHYSSFLHCYNPQQKTQALLLFLNNDKPNHFGDTTCSNHDWATRDDDCTSINCFENVNNLSVLKQSPSKPMKCLCCKNMGKHLNFLGVEGECV